MKADGGIFWGILLVVIGILFILKYSLHLNISIFRIVIAVILIYLGVSLIFGQFRVKVALILYSVKELLSLKY